MPRQLTGSSKELAASRGGTEEEDQVFVEETVELAAD